MGLEGDAREMLAGTHATVAGVGSVGQRVADHLARLHVGTLDLIDPKPFTANFDTQAIRSRADVGRSKVHRVGRWVKDVSPETTVRTFVGPIEDLPWPALVGTDVIISPFVVHRHPAFGRDADRRIETVCPLVGFRRLGENALGEIQTATERREHRQHRRQQPLDLLVELTGKGIDLVRCV